jgi:hypothetical protein
MISDKISYAIELNPELNCLQRKPNIPMRQTNKNDELNNIMSYITGSYEKMDLSKWVYEGTIGFLSYIHYNEDQACICSQHDCRDMHFVRHIPTDTIVRLGSKCIQKYRPEDKEKLDTIKRQSKKDDCKREECNEKVSDKRRWWCKDGYCSIECYSKVLNSEKEQREREKEQREREKRERDRMKREDMESERREREENYPECDCGCKAIPKKVFKEGRNKGKGFWTCSKKCKDGEDWVGGCEYFEWFNDQYEWQ